MKRIKYLIYITLLDVWLKSKLSKPILIYNSSESQIIWIINLNFVSLASVVAFPAARNFDSSEFLF